MGIILNSMVDQCVAEKIQWNTVRYITIIQVTGAQRAADRICGYLIITGYYSFTVLFSCNLEWEHTTILTAFSHRWRQHYFALVWPAVISRPCHVSCSKERLCISDWKARHAANLQGFSAWTKSKVEIRWQRVLVYHAAVGPVLLGPTISPDWSLQQQHTSIDRRFKLIKRHQCDSWTTAYWQTDNTTHTTCYSEICRKCHNNIVWWDTDTTICAFVVIIHAIIRSTTKSSSLVHCLHIELQEI